jgi:amidase
MNDAYFAALAADEDLGRTRGIDATLKEFSLDAILLPTDGQPSEISPTPDSRNSYSNAGFTTTPTGIAGYPIITGTSLHRHSSATC